jgi:uncharacterized Fe-S cluster-containing radical SAM superfamily enzyme
LGLFEKRAIQLKKGVKHLQTKCHSIAKGISKKAFYFHLKKLEKKKKKKNQILEKKKSTSKEKKITLKATISEVPSITNLKYT